MKIFTTTIDEFNRLKEINMIHHRVSCYLMKKDWRDYEIQSENKNDTFMVMRYKFISDGVWMDHDTIFVDGKLL